MPSKGKLIAARQRANLALGGGAAPATPVALRSSSKTAGTTTSPLAMTMPVSPNAGDLILVAIAGVPIDGANNTNISGYTQLARAAVTTYPRPGLEFWYKVAAGGEGNPSISWSSTWGTGSSTRGISAIVCVFENVDGDTPFDTTADAVADNGAGTQVTLSNTNTAGAYYVELSARASTQTIPGIATANGFSSIQSGSTPAGTDHARRLIGQSIESAGAVTAAVWDTGSRSSLAVAIKPG